MRLLTDKLVSYEEALRQASNPDDFALKVRGISSTSDLKWSDFEGGEEEEEAPEAPAEEIGGIERFDRD